MKHIKLDQVEEKELYPGFIARIIHTKLQSISYVRCLKGAVLPPHKHAEEQVLNLLEGDMDVTVEGKTVHCHAGDIVHIPSNALHTVTAVSECLAIDLFAPQREAYVEYGTTTF